MPMFVEERTNDGQNASHFERVLSDQPDSHALLVAAEGDSAFRVFETIFNGKPVALALLEQSEDHWQLRRLVVHPATRGRGVGCETLRQLTTQVDHLHLPADLLALARKAGIDS